MYKIILASESPRRKEIMELMGISFTTIASQVEEVITDKEPAKIVQALAALKTEDVASRFKNNNENIIVIGADTMVFYQDKALGKPKDEQEARKMLQMLSGNTHEVYTGVNIIIMKKNSLYKSISLAVCTKVVVANLSNDEIEDYIKTGEPMDKAGAYGIQGRFGIYIKEIIGDYYNVVGLPIANIYETLLKEGINIRKNK